MGTLAVLPLWLAWAHWTARWPWSGDGVSMVLPTALARRALANGRLPVWSPLYFQGESLLNPQSQLLYPPWWVTLAPVHLGDALKLVLGLHFVAAPLIGYWYARRADLPVVLAWGLGAAAALPLAGLSWHYQKTLGWPWLLLIAGQLLPWEWEQPRRTGALIGVAMGALLLASSLYYAWYAAVLVGPLLVLSRERERWLAAGAGAAIGLPAIVFNILPYLGGPRPAPGWWLTPTTVVAGLTGFGPRERTFVDGVQVSGVPFEGYAAVGGGVILLGITGLVLAVRDGRRSWVAGLLTSGGLGLTLAMYPGIYALPVIDIFRTAGRANVVVALTLLILALYACHSLVRRASFTRERTGDGFWAARRAVPVLLGGLLVVNAGLGVVAWQAMDRGTGTDLDASHEFAAALPDECGDVVWTEMYTANGSLPRGHLGMALLEAGYTVDAVYYAAIGASYRARSANGSLTFDLLITPTRLTGATPLTGGSAQRVRGTVRRQELRYRWSRQYRGDQVHVYARRGAC